MWHRGPILLSTALLCLGVRPSAAHSEPQAPAAAPAASTAKKAAPAAKSSRPTQLPPRAEMYYTSLWGVDSLEVKLVESGELVKFSYRVVNADRAKPLNDKKLSPALQDEQAHVSLQVPQMEKVGQLRQSSTPEAGKIYWMLFSNKGGYVKRGDRVNVVIGTFHANGLIVN